MARRRLYVRTANLLLICILVSACQPRQAVQTAEALDIHAIVATSMAGTQQARSLATIVAATFAAIAAAPGASRETLPGPTAPASATGTSVPPGACTGGEPGKTPYIDAQEGYCFLYPEDFFVARPGAGIVEFLGKPLDNNPDPIRARINITRKEPVGGRTLDEIAASLWQDSRNPYRLSNIQLGGQDALVAENLVMGEADWKTKQLFFTHNSSVYLVTFSPVDTGAPYAKALPDIQRFWDLAIPSFRFIQ